LDVFDKNVPKDRHLSEASFDLKSLLTEPIQDDVWCKVKRNNKERGAVRIRAAYFPIEKPQPTEDGSEPIPVQSNSGILTISVPQAKDISQNSRIKSQCRVLFNGHEVYQSKNVLGTNPGYWTDLDVFVTDLQAAQVNVELISDGAIIGTYGVSGTKLLKSSDEILRNAEDKVEFVSMQGGSGAAKLKMSAVWKPILMDPAAHRPVFGVIRVKIMASRDLLNTEAIGGDSDLYVVIVGAGSVGCGRIKTIDSDLNLTWSEIHYVAVAL